MTQSVRNKKKRARKWKDFYLPQVKKDLLKFGTFQALTKRTSIQPLMEDHFK